MKFWGSLVLLAVLGCASAPRTAPPPLDRSGEAREMVDRLRVEATWQPPLTGGQVVSTFYELPYGSYVAQGWYLRGFCGWERGCRWTRTCRPLPFCPEW